MAARAVRSPEAPATPAEPTIAVLIEALNPEVRDALADVDRSLIALSLEQSPWDRLRSASRMAQALARIRDAATSSAADLPALLTQLCDAEVEFIVVGGAAAVIQGAPITTNDLDIVHRRTPENVVRLLGLVLRLDAIMRHDLADRGLRPTAEMLAEKGQINLSTSLGPLDPLCELGEGQGYEELLPHTESVVDEGRPLRVLDLPTLIAVKTKAGRAKDRLMLPILIATLQERGKSGR